MKGGTKDSYARIGIANTLLCKLYRFVVTKREHSITARLSVSKLLFVPIRTCGNKSWFITERVLWEVQAAERGYERRKNSRRSAQL